MSMSHHLGNRFFFYNGFLLPQPLCIDDSSFASREPLQHICKQEEHDS